MFVAATNPCEDVFRGAADRDTECTEAQRSRYYSKISGPLLDRIDIQVEVPGVKFKDIVSRAEGECSEAIRNRVVRARERQLDRFAGRGMHANAQMGPREVKACCRLDREGEKL
jgi:magnesium chelatase family protein